MNARVDANKAIFTFSTAGIGLLIAIENKLQSAGTCVRLIYIGALVAFFVAVCATLFVHSSNAKAIESYIRGEGNEESKDFKLNTWKYVNYISFVIGLTLSLVFTIIGIF